MKFEAWRGLLWGADELVMKISLLWGTKSSMHYLQTPLSM